MAEREIIIDGSEGEGGGQVLRTSLSLSAITGKPVRIENVRGKRKKPGLFRQHLTAFKAAAEICGARMEGAELKSPEIAFHPGEIQGGDYAFSIGSAGAANLVAQTVLPILSHAPEPSRVVISGGTHNMWAPTFDFFNETFLPLYRKTGGRASANLVSYGFYPAGGGAVELSVKPRQDKTRLELIDRGEKQGARATAVLANIRRNVAEREIKTLMSLMPIAEDECSLIHVDGPGPGNVLTAALVYENITQLFTALGQQGVRAEAVAKDVASQAKDYMRSDAVCGPHLADQLLLPMALSGGGVFTALDITQHTRTNIDIIRAFLDVDITLSQTNRKCWTVTVTPRQ